VAPTTAETLSKGDPYKVQNALAPRWQGNARWVAALPTINALAQMETTSGSLQFPEIANDKLLCKPLHELSEMDGSINPAASADNLVLLYGSFEQYVVVTRIGAVMERISHLFGANGWPTGQRGFWLYMRVGADAIVPDAFRILNVETTA
jgi:HK97 family phage major capsid protein